ncbi:MAG: glucose-6-phosphate dehydrogenase [Bacteroidales bacterium]
MSEAKSQILVIFGASGDLTKRKLIPALFQLHKSNRLPKRFAILGTGRTQYDDQEYQEYIREQIIRFVNPANEENEILESFIQLVHYQQMEPSQSAEYSKLKNRLKELDKKIDNPESYLFYLATPPSLYGVVPLHIKEQGLNLDSGSEGVKRIIVEKPFGYNLDSALELNTILRSVFNENQIYRIDHFLGKETVLNIMALRFSNGIFEPLWNRNYIEYIEVTAVENLGMESRGGFYDGVGAMRDMVQNHLSQLVAVTTMEPPSIFNADNFRNEVLKVYQSLKPMVREEIKDNVVRGQYIDSQIAGKSIVGYRNEKSINSESRTETYLAMKLFIDNWRWEGVPIYMRTGKQMPTKVSEIVIHFKPTPHLLFKNDTNHRVRNKLIIRLQPNEGVVLRISMKVPGGGYEVKDVALDFTYDKLGGVPLGDAYARLLDDCMMGDATLFTRSDAVEESWRFFDPILKEWQENQEIPLCGYPAGSWGPKEAEALMSTGHSWTNPCKNLTNTDLYCEL